MAVTDYLLTNCKYNYTRLKNVLYLVSEEHIKNVHIDNGEAYIDGLTELPLRINGFNIQFNEETSLDERYKFQKTISISMRGYVSHDIFLEKYYAIIEDVEGIKYMVNVDFPNRITHTFNLSQNTNQTDFTFSSLSNFPTLKLNAEFETVEPLCYGYNVSGIDKLELIECEKARLDAINQTVISTESFKKVDYLKNSCSFQEVYDGFKVIDTITFNIALDDYKPSWQYNLLEFLDNRYSAIITPKGDSYKYYPGYNFGLQPNYTIQASSNNRESGIITITLIEMSSYGATASANWDEDQSSTTKWRWVKNLGATICYECVEFGVAKYLVKQEVDIFGNPTGNYQVLEGYEQQFPNLNIVDTFSTEEFFENYICQGEQCIVTTTIPTIVYFNAVTSHTYSLNASCNWEFLNVPDNITVSPISGVANVDYQITISNTATPSSTAIENKLILGCCASRRFINLIVQSDDGCITPGQQQISCLGQYVTFNYLGDCRPNITSIDSKLTYTIADNSITINVPRNNETSAITYAITAENCECSTASTTFYINQDKTYEQWIVQDGYICEDGDSYHIEQRYTGTTQDNINVRTDETRKGSLIQSGDSRCITVLTKWEWDNESYYCINGNKVKAIFEWISYDDGINWQKTGNTQLGEIVEEESEWCDLPVTYSWVLSSNYECNATPTPFDGKLKLIYDDDSVYTVECDSTSAVTSADTMHPGFESSAITTAIIGNCVTSIDDRAFSYDKKLTSVTIGDNVQTIGNAAFQRCDSLTSINIPDSVTSIGNEAFEMCGSLTGITIPDSVTSIGDESFSICQGLTNLTIGNGVTSIGNTAFYECYGLTSVVIPNSVTTIGNNAFNACSGLTSLTIGNSVPTIGERVFLGCYSLTSVAIPNSVTEIGYEAFYACKGLHSITIPDSVASIGEHAFGLCSGMTNVTIGNGITSIGSFAFNSCTSLTGITILATTPPALASKALRGTNNCPIYVPAASVEAYKAASGWSDYTSRITAII